jgi:hypothetical protein
MSQNLEEVDQEFQRGYMSIFLTSSKEDIYIYMSIFLIRYVLKSYGNRPGAPRRIYEYIPC